MRFPGDERISSSRSSPLSKVRPEIALRLHSVYRTTTERILVVLGSVDAEIKYDASGWAERVLVNGDLMAQSSGLCWSWKIVTVAPQIKFRLNSGGLWLPAQVDVSVYLAFWKGIKDFRLTIADTVVYEERANQVVIPEDATTFIIRAGSP